MNLVRNRYRSCRFCTAIALTWLMWIISMSQLMAMTDADQIFPPIAPNDEEVVLPANPSFESECMSVIAADATKFSWQFKNSILTRSKTWGLVWRVDFTTPRVSASANFVNRVTCWRSGEVSRNNIGVSIAFGQRVKPL